MSLEDRLRWGEWQYAMLDAQNAIAPPTHWATIKTNRPLCPKCIMDFPKRLRGKLDDQREAGKPPLAIYWTLESAAKSPWIVHYHALLRSSLTTNILRPMLATLIDRAGQGYWYLDSASDPGFLEAIKPARLNEICRYVVKADPPRVFAGEVPLYRPKVKLCLCRQMGRYFAGRKRELLR